MNKIPFLQKYKHFFSDTLWSIAGLVLMNVVAQFVVYPLWNRQLGSEIYGNIVYMLAVMNTIAVSVGSGLNYARMKHSVAGKTANGPYLTILACCTGLMLPILLLCMRFISPTPSPVEFILYCFLGAATMWRFYADVEYRLHINYKGYFLYYFVISLGYLLGMELFILTNLWPLALLPGELAGLVLVLWKGKIFRRDTEVNPMEFNQVLRLAYIMVGSSLVTQLIFNGDRILLRIIVNGTAVTTYYLSSLLGKTIALVTTPLNGVLIGYLSKYNGRLTRRIMHGTTVLSLVAVTIATVACVAVSNILLPLMYPNDFTAAKAFLFVASLAQVLFFIGNVLVFSVLLRFTKAGNQLAVNIVYSILFCSVCIPLAILQGVKGFCFGLLAVNAARFVICIVLGYRNTREEKTEI